MRVLVAPDAIGHGSDALGAIDAAARLAHGWAITRPADEILVHPLSAGDRGLIEVMQHAVGGEREVAVVRDPWGDPVPVTWLRVGGTGYVEATPLLGEAACDDAVRLAVEGSSAGLGDLVLAVVRSGVTRVVIGAGEVGVHDGGVGALRALAGVGNEAGIAAAVTRAAAATRGVEVVVAAAVDRPLLGLSGAGAALAGRPGIDAELAQRIELELAAEVARIEAVAPRPASLLGSAAGNERRESRRPRSGAGGGIGFAIAAVGGRLLPGADVVAAESGLARAIEGVDVVLTGCSVLDGDALAVGVPGAVGTVAARALVPVVGVAPVLRLGRRELAATGVEGVYPLTDPAPVGRRVPDVGLADALSQRAARVARTWSR